MVGYEDDEAGYCCDGNWQSGCGSSGGGGGATLAIAKITMGKTIVFELFGANIDWKTVCFKKPLKYELKN